MKAGFLTKTGKVDVREVPIPEIGGPGELLLRNRLSTICGSDTHVLWDNDPATWSSVPGYPGHESVAEVVKSTDPAYSEGDLVLAVPNLKHAGGFAEYQVLPSSLVIKLPKDATAEKVILAQQLGTVIYGMKRFHTTVGNGTVMITGAGPVGLFFTAMCRRAGFTNIVVSDLHQHRLNVAEKMGATKTVIAGDSAIVKAVQAISPDGAYLAVEAAGKDETRIECIDGVTLSGRIGYFGMPEGETMLVPFEKLYRRKPTVEFCWDAQAEPGHESFKEALDLIQTGAIDITPVALKEWDIENLQEALDTAHEHRPGFVKAGIRFS